MPELPEVETVRRSLLPLVKGETISEVCIYLAKAVKPAPEEFATALTGKGITDLQRRGKYLLMVLDSGQQVAFHLRMSGRLVWQEKPAPLEKHTTLVLYFDSGYSVYFIDPRKFGTAVLFPPAPPPAGSNSRPEPLTAKKEEPLAL